MSTEKWSHRRSGVTLLIKDGQGKPVAGREIGAKLVKHAFLFGCGAFETLPLFGPKTGARDREQLEKLFESWLMLFNYGTLPFYQGRYERVQGQPDEARMRLAAQALASRGVSIKGHPLCWHTVAAKWLMGLPVEDVLQNQLARVRRDMGAFKGLIRYWDVINEAVIMPEFTAEANAITPLCQKLGRVPLIKRLFDTARETDPGARLLINDFNLSERYHDLIVDSLAAGAPIDVIGLQTHQHQGAMALEKLQSVVERFAPIGLPLHFTENTLISGALMPKEIVDLNDFRVDSWPSTPEGEDRQARDLIQMLDFLFGCESVEAITNWDFVDDAWLHAPAGLVRTDGSRKPAYEAMLERVRGDWATNVILHTDETGRCELTGYRGDYALTFGGLKGSLTLCKGMGETEITLE